MATILSESNRPTPIYEYVCLGDASNRNPRRDVFFFSQFRIHSEMGYGKRYTGAAPNKVKHDSGKY